eukprot:RCo008352
MRQVEQYFSLIKINRTGTQETNLPYPPIFRGTTLDRPDLFNIGANLRVNTDLRIRLPRLNVEPPRGVHLNDVVLGLLVRHPAIHEAVLDAVLHGLGHVAVAADVDGALLLHQEVVQQLGVLLHQVLHVDLLLGIISAERRAQVQQSLLDVALELLLQEVLLLLVLVTEVQHHLPHLDALLALPRALAQESNEGGQPAADARHHLGALVAVGELHGRGVDAALHDLARLQLLQHGAGQPRAEAARGGGPGVNQHQAVHLTRGVLGGGGDGVVPRLDVGHHLDQVLQGRLGGLEQLQHVRVVVGLGQHLAVLALPVAHLHQALLLASVGGEVGQVLVEAAVGLPQDVQDLGEQVLHGDALRKLAHPAVVNRDHGLGVQPVEGQEIRHGLLVVLREHPQRVPNAVGQVRLPLNGDEVALVVLGGDPHSTRLALHRGGVAEGPLRGGGIGGEVHRDCGLEQLVLGRLCAQSLPHRGDPLIELGLKLVLVAVIPEHRGNQALRPQLRHAGVHQLGGVVEEVVAAVTQSKHAVLQVLQPASLLGLLQLRPEGLAVLGERALPTGGNADHHQAHRGQLRGVDVVQALHGGRVLPPLEVRAQLPGQRLGIARLRPVQDCHSGPRGNRRGGLVGLRLALVAVHAALDLFRKLLLQHRGLLGVVLVQVDEAVLLLQEVQHLGLQALGVQLEGVLALVLQPGVVAVQRPVPAVDRCLALLNHLRHTGAQALLDARGIGEQQRGSLVGLGLQHGLHAVRHVPQGDGGHVDVAVRHRHLPQGLLHRLLAAQRELRHGGQMRGLRHLPTRVAVHLSVQHQHVQVLRRGQHVVQATIPNVVGPAITADDPLGDVGQLVLQVGHLGNQGVRLALRLQGLDELLGVLCALVAVGAVSQPLPQQLLQVGVADLLLHGRLGQASELSTALRRGHGHAKAILGIVLEQAVAPGGTMALLVRGVGGKAGGTTPDGGAPRGVGNDHTLPKQLSQQLHVRGLPAALAGSGELQEGALELRALHGVAVGHEPALGQRAGEVPVLIVTVGKRLLNVDHLQGVIGAGVHAHLAPGAVQRGDLDAVVHPSVVSLGLAGLEGLRGLRKLLVVQHERTDHGVRAGEAAVVALGAVVGLPQRHRGGDGTLGVLGGRDGVLATGKNHAGGQVIATEQHHRAHHLVHEVIASGGQRGVVGEGGPRLGILDLLQGIPGHHHVDHGLVHLHDLVTLLPVLLPNGLLQVVHSILDGNHVGQLEEHGLHHHVDTLAQASVVADLSGVDVVHLGLHLGQLLAQRSGDLAVPVLHGVVPGVENERASHADVVRQAEALGVLREVAGQVVRIGHQVLRGNGGRTKAQVGLGHTTGLEGIKGEVGLGHPVRLVSDNLNRRAVGTHSTVRPDSPEDALHSAGGHGVNAGLLPVRKRGVGEVITDPEGEVSLGLSLAQVGEGGHHQLRGDILGAQTIPPANNVNLAVPPREGGHGVHEQGFTLRGDLLASVQHRDPLHRLRENLEELLLSERSVQVDHHHANLLFLVLHQPIAGLHGSRRGRAHQHKDVLSIRGTEVLVQLVRAPGVLGDLVHRLLNDLHHVGVERVGALLVLEEHVGALVRPTQGGVHRVQGAGAVQLHGLVGHQLADFLVGEQQDLVHFVRGTESIHEVNEGQAAPQGGDVGDQGKVVGLLHAERAEHRRPSLSDGHDILVASKDGKRLTRNLAGGDVDHTGKQLPSDFVDVGNHQQQPLGGRVGGAHRTHGQGTVHRTGGAGLGLHLADVHDLPEAVLLSLGHPNVGELSQDGAGSDGVDKDGIGQAIRHVGRGIGAINGEVVLALGIGSAVNLHGGARGDLRLERLHHSLSERPGSVGPGGNAGGWGDIGAADGRHRAGGPLGDSKASARNDAPLHCERAEKMITLKL